MLAINVIFVTLSVALSLASLLFTDTTLAALPAAIAQTYLVVNGAPIASDAVTIGAIPLLPVLLVITVTALSVHRLIKDRASLRQLYWLLGIVVGIPLALTLTAAAMLLDASQVFTVTPPPWTAYLRVMGVHVVAYGLGLGPRLWRALLKHWGLPSFLLPSALLALRLIAAWAGLGFAFVTILLIANWHTVIAPGAAVLLLLLYAPNAALAGSWILMGGDYRFGASSWSLFSVDSVPMPALPWLTAVPGTVHTGAWLLIGLLALVTAITVRRVPTYGLIAAVFCGLNTAILVALSSGTVGVYGYVGPTWWLVILLACVWPAAVGAVAMGLTRVSSPRGDGAIGTNTPEPPTVTVSEDTVSEDKPEITEDSLNEGSGAGIGDGDTPAGHTGRADS
ncbi:MAG: DUF6350 family protein [Corynebacterium sp.]|nr:DUF6350 family protein [Corynebacterium sp.]